MSEALGPTDNVNPGGRKPGRVQGLLPALLVGLMVRALLVVAALPDSERFFTLDARQYIALAQDLKGGYLDPVSALWTTGLMRTPGYPLFAGVFMALGSGSVVPVIVAQIALSLLVIVLIHTLVARLLGARAAGYAAMVLALDPATAIYACLLQPETLFTALVLLSLLLWLSAIDDSDRRRAALSGLVAGLAALCRPIGLFLPLPLFVIAATSGRAGRTRIGLALVCLAGFALPVGGWVARNAAYTGAPILSAIEGENLLNYRAAGALAAEEGKGLEETRADLARELQGRVLPSANPAEHSEAQSRLAVEVLLRHPVGALRSAWDGILRLATGTGVTALSGLRGDPEPERIEGSRERGFQFLFTGLLALWYLGALMGIRELLRLKQPSPLIVAGVFILYFLLISAGPEANTRFRVPIMPFVAVLAGFGFARLSGPRPASRA